MRKISFLNFLFLASYFINQSRPNIIYALFSFISRTNFNTYFILLQIFRTSGAEDYLNLSTANFDTSTALSATLFPFS